MATNARPVPAATPCTVTVDLADALSVGHTIRGLIRQRKVPAGAIDTCARVAEQLILAAQVAMARARGGR